MKCKHHPSEDGAGVCASCLRERLVDLIASHNEQHCSRRRPDPFPPPSLAFPRSVSPYVTHRRSDTSLPDRRRLHHIHRFFSTPQVGPTAENGYLGAGRRHAVGSGRFSFLSALFGRRNRSGDAESVRSGSWISALIRGGRRKKSKLFSAERDAGGGREWGLSPTRDDDDLACSSGYATEWSPAGWRRPAQTPMRRAATTRGGGGAVFGFAVCLSPLVRASPAGGGRRSGAAEMARSGEPWALPTTLLRRQASGGGAALAPNRSRKLADFGKLK